MTDAVATTPAPDTSAPAPTADLNVTADPSVQKTTADMTAPAEVVPPVEGAWKVGLSDELKGFVETKGFKDPAALATSYQNLEVLLGAPKERLLKLPEDMADATAMGEVFSKLGRPEQPDGYKFEVPEGQSKEFSEWGQKTFHELGLTKSQGDTLAAKWNEYVGELTETQTTEMTRKSEVDTQALKKEWGVAYEAEINKAKQAVREFDLKAETIDKLENAMGHAGVMKFLNQVGAKLGEATFASGGPGRGGFDVVMTPAAAMARIKSLKSDADFAGKFTAGGVSERAEMESLHKMAYPEENV